MTMHSPSMTRANVTKSAVALLLLAALPAAADAGERTVSADRAPMAGGNTVRIDVDDAYIPEIDASIWVIPSSKTEIPFALSSPAGPGGVSVGTVTQMTPPLGSVDFEEGETSSSIVRYFTSQPFVAVAPGWEIRSGYLAISSTPPGVEYVDPWVLWMGEVRETQFGSRGYSCGICLAVEMICRVYLPNDPACDAACEGGSSSGAVPVTSAAPGTRFGVASSAAGSRLREGPTPRGDLDFAWVDVLRRYRDEVLVATPEGQFYADFYAAQSIEMLRASILSPSLLARFYHVATEWAPAIQALVDGQGGTFTITQSMEDNLLALFDTYESVGSPDFAQAIAYERARLQLDQIAGLTMTEYQTQIETLGGVSAVESTSWGRVKALYR